MNATATVEPPAPATSWPEGLTIHASSLQQRGTPAFEGKGRPWSTARRFDGGVQLEWEDVVFEVSATSVVVDARRPRAQVDLYWNTLVATALELRRVTCLHGFMVQTPAGDGVAVIGNSGAGKTTTGRALLGKGCTLVCDDLVALAPGEPPTGRPFVRIVPGEENTLPLDVGGKIREPHPLVSTLPKLVRVLSLDPLAESDPFALAAMSALDHLLRNPYVPFDIATDSTERRLADLLTLVQQSQVIAAKPRSRTPDQFAQILLDGLLAE